MYSAVFLCSGRWYWASEMKTRASRLHSLLLFLLQWSSIILAHNTIVGPCGRDMWDHWSLSTRGFSPEYIQLYSSSRLLTPHSVPSVFWSQTTSCYCLKTKFNSPPNSWISIFRREESIACWLLWTGNHTRVWASRRPNTLVPDLSGPIQSKTFTELEGRNTAI